MLHETERIEPSHSRSHRIQWLDSRTIVQQALYLGYDKLMLYICVKCHEPQMNLLTTKHTGRKREITIFPWTFLDDTVEVMLNPTWDLEHALQIVVNPDGKVYTSSHRVSAKHMSGDSCPTQIFHPR